jgi:hypothetical protein
MSQSDLADAREQIKTILGTATGEQDTNLKIGRIHGYQRWASNRDNFIDLFKNDNNRINAAMITRIQTPEKFLTYGQNERNFVFKIILVYGVKDDEATELQFQDLIEGICLKFRPETNLNNTVQSIYPEFGPAGKMGGIQVNIVDYRMFFGILVHYAEMLLGTMVLVNRDGT